MRSIGLLLVVLFWLPAGARSQEPDGTRWDDDRVELAVHEITVDKLGPEGVLALERAANIWGGIRGVPELRVVLDTGRRYAGRIVWMDEWGTESWQKKENTLAVTRGLHGGGYFSSANIYINGLQPFNFGDKQARGHYDFESVMVHEFGHVLGLAHALEEPSVMSEGLSPRELDREPSDADIAELQALYAASDERYYPKTYYDPAALCSAADAPKRSSWRNPVFLLVVIAAIALWHRRRYR